MNNKIVLVSGKSGTGKSYCLKHLTGKVLYANCENNKSLPFKNTFKQKTITDPHQMFQVFDYAETKPEITTIVIDSMTFLMDMYETMYVIPLAGTKDGQAAWGKYQQFWKELMQTYVARSTKNVIFIGHTADDVNDDKVRETRVKVKGALMTRGIESFFTTVISTKVMETCDLEKFKSKLLTITEDEEEDEYKYVFQTRKAKGTTKESIRTPEYLFSRKELFIDNNIQIVLDRLDEYYYVEPKVKKEVKKAPEPVEEVKEESA